MWFMWYMIIWYVWYICNFVCLLLFWVHDPMNQWCMNLDNMFPLWHSRSTEDTQYITRSWSTWLPSTASSVSLTTKTWAVNLKAKTYAVRSASLPTIWQKWRQVWCISPTVTAFRSFIWAGQSIQSLGFTMVMFYGFTDLTWLTW